MTFTELAPAASELPEPFTDRLRPAVAAYLARFKGSSRAHRIRPALLPGLVRRALPRPARRPAAAPGAVHLVDARNPPVQALHRVPAVLRSGRVLPHLRPGRTHAALTRRARPPPDSARRITYPRVHPPAIRGPAQCGPRITQPLRLRPGGPARPARLADLRSHQRQHRRPRRRTRPPGAASVRQRRQSGPDPAAASRRPGHRPGNRPAGPRAAPAQPPRHPNGR